MAESKLLIFCPTCQRFVGNKDRCPYCDWMRPAQASKVGQLQWQTTALLDESLSGVPAYPTQLARAGDLIFMPLEQGEIIALDSATGRSVWQRALRDDHKLRTQGIAVWGDTLLIGSENLSDLPTRDRALLAWRASDGTDLWNWPTVGDSLSVPLVHDDTAYFASSEPTVYALDLPSRRLRWSAPGLTWSPEAGAIFDQTLVVPSRGPQVAAYSVQDGERLWVFTADDKDSEWLNYRPVVSADTAYLSGWRHKLYAVDRLSGERRWAFRAERGITCPPLIAGDKLLVGVKDFREAEGQHKSGYGLYALDAASGEIVWRTRTDKHIYVPPAIAGDMVLLASDDRRLRALNLSDGSEVWQAALPDKIRAGPLVIDDRVVVGQRDGALQCVWWKIRPPVYPDPKVLLKLHQPLEAAAVMALRGDFAEAAHLFEENGEWRAAAELWREADQLVEAARCYAMAPDLETALGLYRQAGDRLAEARILAQQGKHAEAAAIYEELGKIDLAASEYVAAERIAYAASLLHAAGRRSEAIGLYQQAKQDDRVAELMIEEGHYAEAAETYQRLGKPDAAIGVLLQGGFFVDAAEVYERTGRLRSAAELYEKAGKAAQAVSLYERLQDWQHVADLAEGSGDLPRAAWALTKIGQLSHAAELFERAREVDPALDLYESLGLWDKMDILARQTARWSRQAYALLKKGLMSQAGEAYERAAEQAKSAQRPVEEVAQLYEEAAKCYADEENWLKHSQCWKEVCQLRQWPYLRGQARVTSAFFEDEYNLLELLVQNHGADSARQIHVKSVSPKFMLDITETQEIRSLPAGQSRQLMLSLKPKPGVLGRTRLRIKLTYYSPAQREFEETLECQVEVRSHDEKLVELSHPTPSPVTPGRIGYPPGGTVTAGLPTDAEPFSPPEGPGAIDTVNLHRCLTEYFNEEELRDLCFRLDVDYDDLPGAGKAGKARELITYHERRRALPALIDMCRELRPKVDW
jgi:outer membrane protein assembly factor BamB/tetratricopeptide (TPR) repeat protein